jgi:regulator of replication initiation timing
MSITSLILALLPAIAARVKKPKAEKLALDHWRTAYGALEAANVGLNADLARVRDENAQLRAENDAMRQRLSSYESQRFAQSQQMAEQHQLMAQAQQPNKQLAQYQDLLGINLLTEGLFDCTCVPGRASLFYRD